MKNYILLFLILLLASCTSTKVLTQSTQEFQQELAKEWLDSKKTPLHESERENFKGITFFPIQEKYKVEATFTPIKNGDVIPFPTSAKKIKNYLAYGVLDFIIDGEDFQLTVYQSSPIHPEYPNNLFVPFMDETNGDTSYGGGRYIDLLLNDVKKGKLVLDFNRAYNPYCAYSKFYNCPIPPANNYLNVEIKAGVSYTLDYN